jgi:membrane protein DedA with SNARE-associated domain
MTSFIVDHGLPLLFVIVMLESFGLPLPGETSLILFGVLASQGHYDIVEVIAVASAAAIIGDNLGYWLAREGGRALLDRNRHLKRFADRVLPPTERLMDKHGGKVVFFGRFIAILRFTAAWAAGLGKMPWLRFLLWNAAGGIAWATAVGLLAYYGGKAVADAITKYGTFGVAGAVALLLVGWLGLHYGKRRIEKKLR